MILVHLPDRAPMRREWVVVCDAPDYPAMLTAWELPGQSTVPDRQRLFEAIWTGRAGGRTRRGPGLCAGGSAAWPSGSELRSSTQLAENPPVPPVELLKATSLLNRVVAYIDRIA